MSIVENINLIKERIDGACRRAGRDPIEVRLMGVSKFHPLAAVEEARRGGLGLFGENRVQEALEKFGSLKPAFKEMELHLIGSLQRNKAKVAVRLFDCIESVDRDSLVEELGRLTEQARLTEGRDRPLSILLELHTGEESKAGYPDTESLFRAAEKALAFPQLRLAGLMTMAPLTDSQEAVRGSFRALVRARDMLRARFPDGEGLSWECLSMGMSGDFEIAVEEGSTLVRIGTAIFGARA